MIIFNGVDLTETIPVKIEDIVVSPSQLNPVARQRAIQFGAEFIRMGGGTRKVTVTFALLDIDKDEREAYLQDLRDWASIGKEYTLELPEFPNRHLECAVTSLPDHSYRKWWENKLRIEFTCFNNPYWTSDDLVEAQCGQYFSVGGSAPPIMTIERRLVTSVSGQTYSNGSETMIFNRIPAGNMVIDLNRQTAKIGNNSFMEYFQPASTFITPKVGGRQIITGTGTVRFRERWV